MTDVLSALALYAAVIGGPLVWLRWRDHQRAKALGLLAVVKATVTHHLRGESLVSVQVRPAAPWRTGRVFLSAPRGHEWLIDGLSAPLLSQVPAGYELVLKTE